MKKYFTTHEVAEMCQVSRGSVIRWIHEGKIVSSETFGGHNRISYEDVQKLLFLPMYHERRIRSLSPRKPEYFYESPVTKLQDAKLLLRK